MTLVNRHSQNKHNIALWLLLAGMLLSAYCWAGATQMTWDGNRYANRRPPQNHQNYIPNRKYDPAIEQALEVLKNVRPDQVHYVRSTGVPIQMLNDKDFIEACNRNQPTFLHNEAYRGIGAITEWDGSAIWVHKSEIPGFIQLASVPNTRSLAVLLSHELVHLGHSDPGNALYRHSVLRHWLWHSEEDECYLTEIGTLIRLGHYWIGAEFLRLPFIWFRSTWLIYLGLTLLFLWKAAQIMAAEKQAKRSATTQQFNECEADN